MRYPSTMSAILFLMLRIRRLIVSTLQCRRSAISMMDNPSARRLSIVFSSSVKPHSAISRWPPFYGLQGITYHTSAYRTP